jgi:predicted acyltransferase
MAAPTTPSVSVQPAPAPAKDPGARLVSLDALRGFDMFWIVGGDALVQALHKISHTGPVRLLADQMDHRAWEGFAFYDLIFPLFVFLVGVSLVFSLDRRIAQHGRAAVIGQIFRRFLILYLLGIFYYGGLGTPLEKIRLLGVLQRIAFAYLFAGLAFCYLGTRGRIALTAGILVTYWALMTFVPVPGIGAGHFEEGRNLANWIDKEYLPLRKWDGDHDPEGLLSTLPAIASALLGTLAAVWLRDAARSPRAKVQGLIIAGASLAAAGWLWHLQFPVIKKLWTSSYVLVAGGYSCLLLAVFYQIVDVWQKRTWAEPFIWIGMNPITIYMACALVNFENIAKRFVGGDFGQWLGRYEEMAIAVVGLALVVALSRFLYQRRIFLRV